MWHKGAYNDGDGHEEVSRLKCEFALPQTLSRLFRRVYSSNVHWQICFGVEF